MISAHRRGALSIQIAGSRWASKIATSNPQVLHKSSVETIPKAGVQHPSPIIAHAQTQGTTTETPLSTAPPRILVKPVVIDPLPEVEPESDRPKGRKLGRALTVVTALVVGTYAYGANRSLDDKEFEKLFLRLPGSTQAIQLTRDVSNNEVISIIASNVCEAMDRVKQAANRVMGSQAAASSIGSPTPSSNTGSAKHATSSLTQTIADAKSNVQKQAEKAKAKAEELKKDAMDNAKTLEKSLHEHGSAAAAKIGAKAEEGKQKAKALTRNLLNKTEELKDDAKSKANQTVASAKESVTAIKSKTSELAAPIQDNLASTSQQVQKSAKSAASSVAEKSQELSDKGTELLEAAEQKVKQTVNRAEKIVVNIVSDLPKYDKAGNPYWPHPLPLGFSPPPGYVVRPEEPRPKTLVKRAVPDSVRSRIGEESDPVLGSFADVIDAELNKIPTSHSKNPATISLQTLEPALHVLARQIKSVRQEVAKMEAQKNSELASAISERESQLAKILAENDHSWEIAFTKEQKAMQDDLSARIENHKQVLSGLFETRLKEALLKQSLELQKVWTSQIHSILEKERGGRTGKIAELAQNVEDLSKAISHVSSSWSDQQHISDLRMRLAAIVSKSKAGASFKQELDSLKSIHPGPVTDSIKTTWVPSEASLLKRFSRVANQMEEVSLLPPGPISLSNLIFNKFAAKVLRFMPTSYVTAPGPKEINIAKENMTKGDLRRVVASVGRMSGVQRQVAEEWLRIAVKRLELLQALDIIETEIRAKSVAV